MAEGLERARELEKERDRLEHELDLARRIQRRLLPDGPPHIAGLEIAGGSEPAREVGGDYYDHIPLGDGRVLLVIADVSGKGVPAALLMSAFRASLMSQDANTSAPADVAERLNSFLYRSVDPGKFVTAFLGFLDGRTGQFVYANAGHNSPVLLRRDGTVEWLATGGLILGILSDSRFETGNVRLEPGDMLALYTDGVTEGADATNEQFGEERLVAALQKSAGQPCAEIARSLMREVRAFEGAQGPADDLTVLIARRSLANAS
jgi:sigma-B regulation protein RsbU (phosphoserine phosphatase)